MKRSKQRTGKIIKEGSRSRNWMKEKGEGRGANEGGRECHVQAWMTLLLTSLPRLPPSHTLLAPPPSPPLNNGPPSLTLVLEKDIKPATGAVIVGQLTARHGL